MKIALIITDASIPGGVSHYVNALARALAKIHEVTICSAKFGGLENPGVRHRKIRALATSGFLLDVTFFISCWLTFWADRISNRVLRRKGFDIIHSHHYFSAAYSAVATSHYCEQEGVIQMARRLQGGGSMNLIRRFHNWFLSSLERRLFGGDNSKPLIVLAERMKREFIRHHHTSTEKIFVIHTGVDSETYSPVNVVKYRGEIRLKHSLSERHLLVLFVGGDWIRKGVATAIESFSLLNMSEALLLIVGPGNIAAYRTIARGLGVEDRVLFVGPSRETRKYYAASDIFLLPTLYEAFGLTVLEAMASGLPVLVSREAGAAELIREGIDGLLLNDATDVVEIATKLKMLLRDKDCRRRLGEHARLTALQHTWDIVGRKTVGVYERILGQPCRESGRHNPLKPEG